LNNLLQYPTTRYQGSKRKIIPWIYNIIKDVEFNSALDLFGGSSSVSFLFKLMGKQVTYNDSLRFNYIIGKSLIENSKIKLTDEDQKLITTFNNEHRYNYFIDKNFKKIYYLEEENKWLDVIIENIYLMNHYSKNILEMKKAMALNALFQSCLIKRPFNLFHRNNLSLRTKKRINRKFGNYNTWQLSFEKHFNRFIEEINSKIFDNGKSCKALNKSAFDIENNNYDLVYMDPPYLLKDGRNETSNYARVYHFLEGMARLEDWPSLIDLKSKNKKFKNIYTENDFRKIDIYSRYVELLNKFKDSKIIISYKYGGIPSIDFFEYHLRKMNKKVSKYSIHYKYALNHQNGNAKFNREYLILGL